MRRAIIAIALLGCSDYELNPDDPSEDEVPEDTDPGKQDGDTELPDGVAYGGVQGAICADSESGWEGLDVLVEHEHGVARTTTDADGFFQLTELPVGEHVLVATGPDYLQQIPILISENEVISLQSDECDADCDIPVPCVGLAEAIDRDAAWIMLVDEGIEVANTSDDLDICIRQQEIDRDLLLGQQR